MKHKLNNKKKCPNCGLSMRESDQSCNECGYNERKKPKTKKPLPPGYVCNACGKKDDHAIYDCPSKLTKKQFEKAGKSISKPATQNKKKFDEAEAFYKKDKKDLLELSLNISTLNFKADHYKIERSPAKDIIQFQLENLEMKNALSYLDRMFE